MILFLPLLVFSQDKKENIVEWNTEFLFEINNLYSQFLNKLIYGGYISNNEKNEWIQSGTDNNIFYLELTNGFSFKNNKLQIFTTMVDKISYTTILNLCPTNHQRKIPL